MKVVLKTRAPIDLTTRENRIFTAPDASLTNTHSTVIDAQFGKQPIASDMLGKYMSGHVVNLYPNETLFAQVANSACFLAREIGENEDARFNWGHADPNAATDNDMAAYIEELKSLLAETQIGTPPPPVSRADLDFYENDNFTQN